MRRPTRPVSVDQQSPVRLTEMLRCIYSNPTRGISKSCFFERRLRAAFLRLGRAIDRTCAPRFLQILAFPFPSTGKRSRPAGRVASATVAGLPPQHVVAGDDEVGGLHWLDPCSSRSPRSLSGSMTALQRRMLFKRCSFQPLLNVRSLIYVAARRPPSAWRSRSLRLKILPLTSRGSASRN